MSQKSEINSKQKSLEKKKEKSIFALPYAKAS